ncbi:MAG: hypothetical protein QW210_02915 [Candidatus Woesearchaeota archaeon]
MITTTSNRFIYIIYSAEKNSTNNEIVLKLIGNKRLTDLGDEIVTVSFYKHKPQEELPYFYTIRNQSGLQYLNISYYDVYMRNINLSKLYFVDFMGPTLKIDVDGIEKEKVEEFLDNLESKGFENINFKIEDDFSYIKKYSINLTFSIDFSKLFEFFDLNETGFLLNDNNLIFFNNTKSFDFNNDSLYSNILNNSKSFYVYNFTNSKINSFLIKKSTTNSITDYFSKNEKILNLSNISTKCIYINFNSTNLLLFKYINEAYELIECLEYGVLIDDYFVVFFDSSEYRYGLVFNEPFETLDFSYSTKSFNFFKKYNKNSVDSKDSKESLSKSEFLELNSRGHSLLELLEIYFRMKPNDKLDLLVNVDFNGEDQKGNVNQDLKSFNITFYKAPFKLNIDNSKSYKDIYFFDSQFYNIYQLNNEFRKDNRTRLFFNIKDKKIETPSIIVDFLSYKDVIFSNLFSLEIDKYFTFFSYMYNSTSFSGEIILPNKLDESKYIDYLEPFILGINSPFFENIQRKLLYFDRYDPNVGKFISNTHYINNTIIELFPNNSLIIDPLKQKSYFELSFDILDDEFIINNNFPYIIWLEDNLGLFELESSNCTLGFCKLKINFVMNLDNCNEFMDKVYSLVIGIQDISGKKGYKTINLVVTDPINYLKNIYGICNSQLGGIYKEIRDIGIFNDSLMPSINLLEFTDWNYLISSENNSDFGKLLINYDDNVGLNYTSLVINISKDDNYFIYEFPIKRWNAGIALKNTKYVFGIDEILSSKEITETTLKEFLDNYLLDHDFISLNVQIYAKAKDLVGNERILDINRTLNVYKINYLLVFSNSSNFGNLYIFNFSIINTTKRTKLQYTLNLSRFPSFYDVINLTYFNELIERTEDVSENELLSKYSFYREDLSENIKGFVLLPSKFVNDSEIEFSNIFEISYNLSFSNDIILLPKVKLFFDKITPSLTLDSSEIIIDNILLKDLGKDIHLSNEFSTMKMRLLIDDDLYLINNLVPYKVNVINEESFIYSQNYTCYGLFCDISVVINLSSNNVCDYLDKIKNIVFEVEDLSGKKSTKIINFSIVDYENDVLKNIDKLNQCSSKGDLVLFDKKIDVLLDGELPNVLLGGDVIYAFPLMEKYGVYLFNLFDNYKLYNFTIDLVIEDEFNNILGAYSRNYNLLYKSNYELVFYFEDVLDNIFLDKSDKFLGEPITKRTSLKELIKNRLKTDLDLITLKLDINYTINDFARNNQKGKFNINYILSNKLYQLEYSNSLKHYVNEKIYYVFNITTENITDLSRYPVSYSLELFNEYRIYEYNITSLFYEIFDYSVRMESSLGDFISSSTTNSRDQRIYENPAFDRFNYFTDYSYRNEIKTSFGLDGILLLPKIIRDDLETKNIDYASAFKVISNIKYNNEKGGIEEVNDEHYLFFDQETPEFMIGVYDYSKRSYNLISDFILLKYLESMLNKERYSTQYYGFEFKLNLVIRDDFYLLYNNFKYNIFIDEYSKRFFDLREIVCRNGYCELTMIFKINTSREVLCDYIETPFYINFTIVDPSGKETTKRFVVLLLNNDHLNRVFGTNSLCGDRLSRLEYKDVKYSNNQIYTDQMILPYFTKEMNLTSYECKGAKTYMFDSINLPFINYTFTFDSEGLYLIDCLLTFNEGQYVLKYQFNIYVDYSLPNINFQELNILKDGVNYKYSKNDIILNNNTLYLPEGAEKYSFSLLLSDQYTKISKVEIYYFSDDNWILLYENLPNTTETKISLDLPLNASKLKIIVKDELGNLNEKIIEIYKYVLNMNFYTALTSLGVPYYIYTENKLNLSLSTDELELKYIISYSNIKEIDDALALIDYDSSVSSLTIDRSSESENIVYSLKGKFAEGSSLKGFFKLKDRYGLSFKVEYFDIFRYAGFGATVSPSVIGLVMPDYITFNLNRPVKECIINYTNKYGENKVLVPKVEENKITLKVDNSYDILNNFLNELFIYTYEDKEYNLILSCYDLSNVLIESIVKLRHDSIFTPPSINIKKGAIVLYQWQRMSKIMSHPNSQIVVEFQARESISCEYFYNNDIERRYKLNKGNFISGYTSFTISSPSEEGKYLLFINCTDTVGNTQMLHIMEMNITETPLIVDVFFNKQFSSQPMRYKLKSTLPLNCTVTETNIFSNVLNTEGIYEYIGSYPLSLNFDKITCNFEGKTHVYYVGLNSDFINLSKEPTATFLFDNISKLINISINIPRNVKLMLYPKNYEELGLFSDNIKGNIQFNMPIVGLENTIVAYYLTLLENPQVSKSLNSLIKVDNMDFIVGKILHPSNQIMYNYVIFEIISDKPLTVLRNLVNLEEDGTSLSLDNCKYMVYKYSKIFICPKDKFGKEFVLKYNNTLLDTESVPDSSYILLNLVPGSYKVTNHRMEVQILSENTINEPELVIYSSDDEIQPYVEKLGDKVSYFNYDFNEGKIIGVINLDLDFGDRGLRLIRLDQEKKFVVYIKADPVISNPLPLFIDLRKPTLE